MRKILVGGLISMLWLSGCDEPWPAQIRWDQDVCERCRMLISDPKFAAQLQDEKGKIHVFDDIGDLLWWLKEQDIPISSAHVLVSDFATGQWLDLHKAYFTKDHATPMGFGLAAHAEAIPGALDVATLMQDFYDQGKIPKQSGHAH